MLRGMREAASAMSVDLLRQEIVARNVANSLTTGYKQESAAVDGFSASLDRAEKWLYQTGQPASIRPAVGELGTEVTIQRFSVDMSQGDLEQTQRDLDVSLQGDGFLMVRTAEGDYYSRGGPLQKDDSGILVTAQGYPVLDDQAAEIYLPDGTIRIGTDGSIKVNEQQVAQLGVVEFAPGSSVVKIADGLFGAEGSGAPPYFAESTEVRQGYLEKSNVDFGGSMSELVFLMRAYQASQRMLAAQDDLAGQAINEVAKV